MINKLARQQHLQAHIQRTKAIKTANAAQSVTAKKSAQIKLDKAQAQVKATQAPYEQLMQTSTDPTLKKLAATDRQLIKQSNAAYEQHKKTIEQIKAAAQNARPTNSSQLQKQHKNAQKRRDALSSNLTKTRNQQSSNKKNNTNAFREHRANYILGHRFYVEMDGIIRAAFNECSGFGLDIKKELYLEGGVNDQQRLMLGHAEFQDTVLKRGMTNDSAFWVWVQEMLVGQSLSGSDGLVRTRRNINILMMNQAGTIMQICTLIGAMPIGWKAPAFQADSAAVAIEEMTLAYEGIQLQFQSENEKLAAGGASSSLTRDDLGFFPNN